MVRLGNAMVDGFMFVEGDAGVRHFVFWMGQCHGEVQVTCLGMMCSNRGLFW